jgi:hypothetical protein
MQRQLLLGALLLWSAATAWCADDSPARVAPFSAIVRGGSLIGLQTADGKTLVRAPAEPRGARIHREQGEVGVAGDAGDAVPVEVTPGKPVQLTYEPLDGLLGASIHGDFRFDDATGDLVIRQEARAPAGGVWGVSWWLADIPLDYAILVPGGSGLRLTRDTPGGQYQYDYPTSWEAQLVVVEGPEHGFYVWAEDAAGRFKRLVVERRGGGWRLGLVTINDAPFGALTACDSVTWRLNTYRGDWRVPARRYREWLQANLQPTPVTDQQPAWVRDIRGCVIMGLEAEVLEALPRRFDPPQTLLYLYDWRQAGYDRDYPEYDRLRPQLEPFLRRARELGFRSMLHVNYFGVDPLNPLYKQFEPYHVRDPWGAHEKLWWVWPPEEPDIRFAYINPACRAWRDLFTARMVRLCERTGADALHLDQTLCIYNDHHGRIDGMSMLEGNLALHRQLREALPQVALSGEGLDEITCRYEAFAQRHVSGLDHAKGTYDRRWLAAAHPISSYLLRPFTVMYGYLGCASPDNDQLYAAWNEAYRHWGVIPTLKPTQASLAGAVGFARQFFEELEFWQGRQVQIDLDAAWPADVAFPLRTADGQRVVATGDRRLVWGSREISRTASGVSELAGEGSVPGWRGFDQRGLIGLDPERWYPYFPSPPFRDRFHVCRLPKGLTLGCVAELGDMAIVQVRDAQTTVADLTVLLDRATCGTRPAKGPTEERIGPWEPADGAVFSSFGEVISAHPPWKAAGSGEAFARFELARPDDGGLRFVSDVALDAGAVGPDRSDGVTFLVRASDGSQTLSETLHNDTAERRELALDLTALRGRTISVELAVAPGPRQSPSYDWARWYRPRLERSRRGEETIGVAGGGGWKLALGADGPTAMARDGEVLELRVPVPGAVCFLNEPPPAVRLPVDLSAAGHRVLFVTDSGQIVESPLYAAVGRGASTVGGVRRDGLVTHPPDHGRAVALFPLTLPAETARVEAWVGLRDGSKSDGVVFAVEVNGAEQARATMTPGRWERIQVDLSRWAGQPIVLALVTDSAGSFNFDWSAWGEPMIRFHTAASGLGIQAAQLPGTSRQAPSWVLRTKIRPSLSAGVDQHFPAITLARASSL